MVLACVLIFSYIKNSTEWNGISVYFDIPLHYKQYWVKWY